MRSSRPCVGCSQKPDAAEPDLGLKPLLARLRKSRAPEPRAQTWKQTPQRRSARR